MKLFVIAAAVLSAAMLVAVPAFAGDNWWEGREPVGKDFFVLSDGTKTAVSPNDICMVSYLVSSNCPDVQVSTICHRADGTDVILENREAKASEIWKN